jgi:uncharacterized membrane protein YraQ (UPF0718 family)
LSDTAITPRKVGGARTIVIWLGVSVVAGALCWWLKGPATLQATLQDYVWQLLDLVPRMSGALMIGGFVQVLVPRGMISEWLGDGAGARGVFIAHGVGAMTPGGPILAFPLIAVLANSGASLASVITFATSWATLGLHRIVMWELPFLGTGFALVRYLASIPLGIIAGLTVLWALRLFRRYEKATS